MPVADLFASTESLSLSVLFPNVWQMGSEKNATKKYKLKNESRC